MIAEITKGIKDQIESFSVTYNRLNQHKDALDGVRDVISDLGECWSGSWIGFHASLYFMNFQKLPSWEYQFDSEWGSIHGIPEYWVQKNYSDIESYVKQHASNVDYDEISLYIDEALQNIKLIHETVITDLMIIKNNGAFKDEWNLVEELTDLKWGVTPQDIIDYRRPKQVSTRDSFALQQGIITPPHIALDSVMVAAISQINSIEEFIKKCNRLLRLIDLKSSITDISGSSSETRVANIQDVMRICSKFHQVARQLRSRYSHRDTIEINDEYDVQDLFHSLLKLYFDDIRPEEWNPSYAGAATRSDFLLKKEKIVIEIKKTRASMSDKDLGEQLIIDIAKYKQHPDCKILICFIYDPEGKIGNPSGIEEDLNKMSSEELSVIVKIEPK